MEPTASELETRAASRAGLRAKASLAAACAGLGVALLVASLGFNPLSPALRLGVALCVVVFAWLSWELSPPGERTGLGGLGWALVAAATTYLIACLTAVNVGAAVREAALWAAYVPGFWLARHLGRDRGWRAVLLHAVLCVEAGVAMAGILATVGLVRFAGAIEAGRLASTMLYPNALGVYLLIGLLVGCGLWADAVVARGLVRGSPYAAACSVIAAALMMTFSRGTILAALVGTAALAVLLPRGRRLAGVVFLTVVSAPAAASGLSIAAAGAGDWTAATVALGAGGLLAACALGVGAGVLLRPARGRGSARLRVAAVSGGLLVVLVAIAAVYCWPQFHGPLILAGGAAGRLRLSEWLGYGLLSRLAWMRDGARIAINHILTGAGGGGWGSQLGQYQTYAYYSSDAHCRPVQVWIEAGTPGLLAYLAAWAAFLAQLWRGVRRGVAGAPAGIAAGALALFVHSAYDASVSFPALAVLLVTGWGLGSAAAPQFASPTPPVSRRRAADSARIAPFCVRAGAGLLVCFLATGTAAGVFAAAARTCARRGAGDEAMAGWRLAAALDPLCAEYHAELAHRAQALGARDEIRHDELAAYALAEIQRAAALDRYSAQIRSLLGQIQLRNGKVQDALLSLDKAITLQPYWSIHYDNLASACMALAEKLCLAGRPDQALKLTGHVITLEGELAARARQTPPWLTPAVMTPETTPEMSFEGGRAYLLQGRVEDAVGRLETAARLLEAEAGQEGQSRLGRVLGWLSYGYELLGELNKAEAALARAPDARPGAGEALAVAREVGEAAGLTEGAGRR